MTICDHHTSFLTRAVTNRKIFDNDKRFSDEIIVKIIWTSLFCWRRSGVRRVDTNGIETSPTSYSVSVPGFGVPVPSHFEEAVIITNIHYSFKVRDGVFRG